jgi:hypothetical protein
MLFGSAPYNVKNEFLSKWSLKIGQTLAKIQEASDDMNQGHIYN